jgi:hypothetical protein
MRVDCSFNYVREKEREGESKEEEETETLKH